MSDTWQMVTNDDTTEAESTNVNVTNNIVENTAVPPKKTHALFGAIFLFSLVTFIFAYALIVQGYEIPKDAVLKMVV